MTWCHSHFEPRKDPEHLYISLRTDESLSIHKDTLSPPATAWRVQKAVP